VTARREPLLTASAAAPDDEEWKEF
jgi:hypothetical protein